MDVTIDVYLKWNLANLIKKSFGKMFKENYWSNNLKQHPRVQLQFILNDRKAELIGWEQSSQRAKNNSM